MADGKDIFQNALIMALASGNGAEMKLEEKEAMPGTEDIEVTASEGFDALSKVTVAGDPNLIPENIMKDIDIFGVLGTAEGGGGIPGMTQTVLWEGDELIETNKVFNLSDNLLNYDLIVVEWHPVSANGVVSEKCMNILAKPTDKGIISNTASNATANAYVSFVFNGQSIMCDYANYVVYLGGHLYKILGYKFAEPQYNYSTEEKRIGTWIDGKPLYQKSYKFEINVKASTAVSESFPSGIDLSVCCPVSYNYSIHQPNNSASGNNYYASSTDYHRSWLRGNNSTIEFRLYSSTAGVTELYVTIQYTKTTD